MWQIYGPMMQEPTRRQRDEAPTLYTRLCVCSGRLLDHTTLIYIDLFTKWEHLVEHRL